MTSKAPLPTEEVVARYRAGTPIAHLSEQYGCTYSRIYRLLNRAGVDTHKASTLKARLRKHRDTLQELLGIMEKSLENMLNKGVDDARTERLRAQIYALREVIK